LLGVAALERGTGSVRGIVYADWNANGMRDPEEPPLPGIPLVVGEAGSGSSRKDGAFTFTNVPAGLREVALDMGSLPVDFDPPTIPKVLLDVAKGRAAEVSFGLIPLGAIRGRVMRDLNSSGSADEGDEAIDGAVLVLDEGLRSERVRAGRFAFEAVRSGAHRIRLLIESLPEGSVVSGEVERTVMLERNRAEADVVFLVSIERRPEIRRVFPGGRTPPAAARMRPPTAPSNPAAPPTRAAAARPSASPAARRAPGATAMGGSFSVQVAALDDPLRAKSMVEDLKRRGYPSYLVRPPAADPEAPFRVRVGHYGSRTDADRIVKALEREGGGKLWIVKDAPTER
jgi:hypothetical protein